MTEIKKRKIHTPEFKAKVGLAVPTVEGDSNENAGYSSFGRLYAIGYIRGLRQGVYGL